VIPARGGSKGLPGKNLAPLGGLPLVAHSIRLAALCPEIDRVVVSTDSEEIAELARAEGAEVPFLRPAELAQDDTAMWPVLRHALSELDADDDYELLVLLDPTSPGRLPADVAGALRTLAAAPEADGVVAVSEPPFNPIWHSVVDEDGWMAPLIPGASRYGRRQDVPRVFRINAALYVWRTAFVRREQETWMNGRHRLLEIPERRALHIDEPWDLELAELLLSTGALELPWLER
jgi:N-acylneuraminate cytidylyltransferase